MNMDHDILAWGWTVVLLPVLIGVFKSQIGEFIGDYMLYRNRRYDSDGDPGTGQWCMVQSAATGEWCRAFVEKYTFSIFRPSKRLVHVWFPHQDALDPNFDKCRTEWIKAPMPFKAWRSMMSGGLPKEALPENGWGEKEKK